MRENVMDEMNRISENVMISKLIYRSKIRKRQKGKLGSI